MAGGDPKFATTSVNLDEARRARELTPPVPGVVVIVSENAPDNRVLPLGTGVLEVGRGDLAVDGKLDGMASRKHARIEFDGSIWVVEDLGSRNGTYLAGERLVRRATAASGALIRIGGALLLLTPDTVPFQHYGVGVRAGVVGGPSLRKALELITVAQGVGVIGSLMISGETGAGKEIAAKAFHAAGPNPKGPFIAVNCATIPRELAERLLFGSRRGAFSGATDAEGYVQSANGGTLFLDEIADLPVDVQTKLLRVLEMREVVRLGGTTPEKVNVRICAATWKNLRALVGEGRFREDLYFRIAHPEVTLPPLRERTEELPWHVQQVLDECRGSVDLQFAPGFIEGCARRAWPGNVRELRAEVLRAATAAAPSGARTLTSDDLAPHAGFPIPSNAPVAEIAAYPEDDIARALEAEAGNVSSAARRMGVHRNKIRRWLEQHRIDALIFKSKPKRRTP